jgi:hypothetical protein
MPPAITSSATGFANASTLNTGSITVASGQKLVVGVCTAANTATVTSVTFNSGAQALSYVTRQTLSTTCNVEYWEITAPSAGTGTVTVNISAAVQFCAIAAIVDSADSGAGYRDAATTSSGTSTTPSLTITSATNDLAVAFIGNRNTNSTWTPSDSEVTVVTTGTGTSHQRLSMLYGAGAASVTLDGVYGGSRDWCCVGTNINQVPTGSDTPISALRPSLRGGLV